MSAKSTNPWSSASKNGPWNCRSTKRSCQKPLKSPASATGNATLPLTRSPSTTRSIKYSTPPPNKWVVIRCHRPNMRGVSCTRTMRPPSGGKSKSPLNPATRTPPRHSNTALYTGMAPSGTWRSKSMSSRTNRDGPSKRTGSAYHRSKAGRTGVVGGHAAA